MNRYFWELRYFFPAAFSICLCIWFAAHFLLHPPVYAFSLKAEGLVFALWPSEQILSLRWVLALLAVLLAGVTVALCRWTIKKSKSREHSLDRRAIDVLAPLSVLPLACVPLFTADVFPPLLSTNVPLFILLGAVSFSLAKLFTPLLDGETVSNQRTWPWAWSIFLIAFIGYAHGGYQLSKAVGEHVGDEGHYLIQAQSLYEDRDLDIKKQLMNSLGLDPSHINRGHYHVARQSRDDAWYSWHPFGLSLLLAPSWKWGLGGRHIVLGIISGAGLAGLFLLCRRMGAGSVASSLAVLSLGTSVYWVLYSFRAMPEVLGATLIIWAFWAIAAQKHRPWTTLFVAAACCVYLPFAQTRFIPMSLMALGLYGLFGLLGNEKLRPKLVRLSTFTACCLAGFGVYLAVQFSMFSGGSSYPIKTVLLSYPLGAWAVIVSDRGLISLLPVFFWLCGAMIAWFWVDKENRFFSLGISATFLACLLTSTTYYGWAGGSSVPGRYLLAVTPLLFVGAAVMLERVSFVARTWFIFLSLFSAIIFLLMWNHLPLIGRSFIFPRHEISMFPLMQDFFFPHSTFSAPLSDGDKWTNIFVFISFASTFIVILLHDKSQRISYFVLLSILLSGIFLHNIISPDRFSFQKYLASLDIQEIDIAHINQHSERLPWKQQFGLHAMPAFTGKISHLDGLNVRIASQDADSAGFMAFGHYTYIFPGKFNVNFEFETENCFERCIAATLDVSADYGDSLLQKKKVYCDNSVHIKTISFSSEEFIVIEPRVYYSGCGDFVLQSLHIEEIIDI